MNKQESSVIRLIHILTIVIWKDSLNSSRNKNTDDKNVEKKNIER